jgi:hypothetical protein
MIFFLVTTEHQNTVAPYASHWRRELAPQVQVVPYAALTHNAGFPPGTYVFSDLERLTTAQRALLSDVWEQLAGQGGRVRLLNHPQRSFRRLELLQTLAKRGKNAFNVFHPADPARPWRFPVFLRLENQHNGNLSPLLSDQQTLEKWLVRLVMMGAPVKDLLVVEFCDTKDAEGIYRKYSAFRVGERIFPRHLLFSRKWLLKDMDLVEPALREELKAYVATNPHEPELRSIFELANIQYGRIDYSLLDGRIQAWEINTNPIILKPPAEYPDFSLPFHEAFAQTFNQHLREIDEPRESLEPIPITWHPHLIATGNSTGN